MHFDNRTGMADERGAFDGGQPGEWTPSAGPAPGAGWAPIGGTQGRAYTVALISMNARNYVVPTFVRTDVQHADGFTKPLARPQFLPWAERFVRP